MSFLDLQLSAPILKAIWLLGYGSPTPIQEQAIPRVMAGEDLIATSRTGTGKTAAFVLPALERLSAPSRINGRGPRILVLTPTRELANQITSAVRDFGRFLRVKAGSVLGGHPYYEQERLLSQAVDIVVATPGRLIDHINSGRADLSRLEMLVLDEADRMLDMGFSHAVQTIAAAAPKERQTLLFTATWDRAMEAVANRLTRTPVRIDAGGKRPTLDLIEQRLHAADDRLHKDRLLGSLVSDDKMTRAIVFSATKRHADQLARKLRSEGHAAEALHGDMSQNARNRAMDRMRRGSVRLLIATDLAARGLDVAGITHVINYDLPRNGEDYVHRIGRTGRAGATGIAISLAVPTDWDLLARIERYIGRQIERHVIPGLEPRQSIVMEPGRRQEAGRGRHFSKKTFRRPGSKR